jgi:hypothetical protein
MNILKHTTKRDIETEKKEQENASTEKNERGTKNRKEKTISKPRE